jgi:hypothetical protein
MMPDPFSGSNSDNILRLTRCLGALACSDDGDKLVVTQLDAGTEVAILVSERPAVEGMQTVEANEGKYLVFACDLRDASC